MTESENDTDHVEPPVVTGESMIPPTEVSWYVDVKAEFVTLCLTSNDRVVDYNLMVRPDEARQIGYRLHDIADEIELVEEHTEDN